MAFETQREKFLLTIVVASALVALVVVAGSQLGQYFTSLDDEIATMREKLEKQQTIYSNLEGIEQRFDDVYADLYIEGSIDQQKSVVFQDLIDLINEAELGDNYGAVDMDQRVEESEDGGFYIVRLTVDDIRASSQQLARFLWLIDRMSTMEVELLSLRAGGRRYGDTVRATVKVTRLVPTDEFMQGLKNL